MKSLFHGIMTVLFLIICAMATSSCRSAGRTDVVFVQETSQQNQDDSKILMLRKALDQYELAYADAATDNERLEVLQKVALILGKYRTDVFPCEENTKELIDRTQKAVDKRIAGLELKLQIATLEQQLDSQEGSLEKADICEKVLWLIKDAPENILSPTERSQLKSTSRYYNRLKVGYLCSHYHQLALEAYNTAQSFDDFCSVTQECLDVFTRELRSGVLTDKERTYLKERLAEIISLRSQAISEYEYILSTMRQDIDSLQVDYINDSAKKDYQHARNLYLAEKEKYFNFFCWRDNVRSLTTAVHCLDRIGSDNRVDYILRREAASMRHDIYSNRFDRGDRKCFDNQPELPTYTALDNYPRLDDDVLANLASERWKEINNSELEPERGELGNGSAQKMAKNQ